MTECRLCPLPLDYAATANGLDVCTTCALQALRASRTGTRAVVVSRAEVAPAVLRDRGQELASVAHSEDRAKVDAAIRQLASSGRPFSANECRGLHGVHGPVVGAAFTAARKAGLIRAVGFTTSTDPGTHAHPVRTWVGAAASEVAA